jgi:hypothetical protein
MKKSLLATVAAVALFAGTGLAFAAEGAKEQPGMKSGAEIKAEPEMKKGADIKSGAEMKADTKANADQAKPSTTGQASEQKSAPAAKSSTSEKAAPAAGSSAQSTQAPAAGSAAQSQTGASTNAQTSAAVNLTPEQKSTIRTSVLQSSSAPKVSRSQINFTISVGTVVPRTVKFVTVPDTIVRIHPAWRGYSYFIVDDEIIIVEPRSFKIVAVLTV